MKKISILMLALSILFGGYFAVKVIAEPFYYDRTFNVTTVAQACNTGEGRSGRLIRRNFCSLTNVGNNYDVYMATWAIPYADRTQGDKVTANGGYWDNTYWIYKSTWWVIADLSTVTVHYRESE